MNILWLRHDRSGIINDFLLNNIQNAIAKLVNVDFISHKEPLNSSLGLHNDMFCKEKIEKIPYFDTELDKIDLVKYDCIVCDTPSMFFNENFKSIKIPKIGYIEDMHGMNGHIVNYMIQQEFDAIIHKYNRAKEFLLPQLKNYNGKLFWLPHSLDTNYFEFSLNKKINDVVLLGEIHPYFYPLRNSYYNTLKDELFFKYYPRPADYTQNPYPIKQDYVKVLNQSKIGLTCGLIYQYPVMKFFEFPSCGCMLMCIEMNELYDLGFIPNKHYISIKDLSYLKEEIQFVLSNDSLREEICYNAKNLIEEKHNSMYRAKELLNFISDLLGMKKLYPEVIQNDYIQDTFKK